MGDWTGDSNSIYKTLGASNHTDKEREVYDYYATDPISINLLFEVEEFNNIWECACGEGHLSKRMVELGKTVYSTDIIDRGYGNGQIDFLLYNHTWHGDIITNPPYKYAQEFIEKAMQIISDGHKVAMFLKLQFLEGKKRKHLFEKYPPKIIYVSSSRILCAKNGEFEMMKKNGGSAVAYAWYVWEKGYIGNTIIKWIN
jgi:hypothetical protein